MMLKLRENLQGTLAVVLIVVVVVIMVVSGQEMLKSSVSDRVASVNGVDISGRDLSRAMMSTRARMQEQMQFDENAEQLKDENLRQPALNSLLREKALLLAAQKAGMGVSDAVIKDQIKQSFTQDKQFNAQIFNGYLSRYGYTQASLIEHESGSYLLRQLVTGLTDSAFVTASDLELLASIAGQKRTYSTITIPKEKVASKVVVTDEEVTKYYADNQPAYTEEEKVSVQYVALSVDELAKSQHPTMEQIQAAFEAEQKNFVATPEYVIAHILVDAKTDKSEVEKRIANIKAKLGAGESFESVAKTDSDDLGSKESGGSLGVMEGDIFPESFRKAVYALGEGLVSEPVTSDAGTHFVKLIKKNVPVAPTLASRQAAISSQLAKEQAGEKYMGQLKDLEELTYGKDNLDTAAQQLGLDVKVTELFGRTGGAGIAANPALAEAAFAKDVLEQGQNSKVLELGNDTAVVVRLKDHAASHLKPLPDVKAAVVATLTQSKINAALQALANQAVDKLNAGTQAEQLAKELGYAFKNNEAVDRFRGVEDREVVQHAFDMVRPLPNKPLVESFASRAGDYLVISLVSVVNGSSKDMEPQGLAAMKSQVASQQSNDEIAAYEQAQFAAAKIRN